MKTIKVAFQCMWGRTEDFKGEHILECFPYLRQYYRFELSDDPEFVFHSVYGYVDIQRYPKAKRFVYAGEPGEHFAAGAKVSPGVTQPGFYHYGITCSLSDRSQNHRYMPQGLLHVHMYNGGMNALLRRADERLPSKDLFANFIYSNGSSKDRINFFHKLSKYKRVESCGAVERNNNALASAAYSKDGYLIKQAFQARCKFSISMENNYFDCYVTEKLTDPLIARSVPIYRGAPSVGRFFNPRAFINISDFPSDEAAIEHIINVDNDDALYRQYLEEPAFVDNVIPPQLSDDHYLQFFHQVFA